MAHGSYPYRIFTLGDAKQAADFTSTTDAPCELLAIHVARSIVPLDHGEKYAVDFQVMPGLDGHLVYPH